MALPARISIATLGVSDLARSTKFYLALGWELAAGSSAEISFFRTAGGILALYPFDLLAKDAMAPASRAKGSAGSRSRSMSSALRTCNRGSTRRRLRVRQFSSPP